MAGRLPIQIALCGTLLLGACGTVGVQNANPVREQAEVVVSKIISSRFPGVDVAPVSNCVIDNATDAELFSIAKASVLGPDQTTINQVVSIVQRPDTLSCIINNGVSLLGLQGA